jgi:hypothetical protein
MRFAGLQYRDPIPVALDPKQADTFLAASANEDSTHSSSTVKTDDGVNASGNHRARRTRPLPDRRQTRQQGERRVSLKP